MQGYTLHGINVNIYADLHVNKRKTALARCNLAWNLECANRNSKKHSENGEK
jgi:hypothetical protein